MKHIYCLVAFIIFAGFSVLPYTGTAEGSIIGKQAPDFKLDDINGKRTSLSELRGKVVLVNFWATTCIACKEEVPSLNRLYSALKDKGFVILAVAIERSESRVRSFVSEYGMTFAVLVNKNNEVPVDRYGVFGLPTSFLIDKSGIVVEKFIGGEEWDSTEMRDKIIKLLNR